MADAVSTQVISDGPKYAVIKFTNISDGTGEAAVVKVDPATLSKLGGPGADKAVPTELSIERIWYDTDGMGVDILWDANTPVLAHTLTKGAQWGDLDFSTFGGLINNGGAGKNGKIKFTTTGTPGAGARYSITLKLKKVA